MHLSVWIKSEWTFKITGENLEELKVEWKWEIHYGNLK